MGGLPIQDWELTQAREAFRTTLMVATAQHRRPLASPTASGGQTRQFVVLGNVQCRLEPLTDQQPVDTFQGGGQKVESFWELLLPIGTPVQTTDQFVIDGVAFDVVDTDAAGTNTLEIAVRLRRLQTFAPILVPNALAAGWQVRPSTLLRGLYLQANAVNAGWTTRTATLQVG